MAPAAGHPPAPFAAVVFSGDMGIRLGMGRHISTRLAADGVPVLRVNSLAFFRENRTPKQVEALVRMAIERGLIEGGNRDLILIGQSFGADALQLGLAGLPQQLRARVRLVALVVPSRTVYLRATPSEIFNFSPRQADALPTAERLNWSKVLCIQGAEEAASLCPMLRTLPNVTRAVLPGGHPLRRDDARVYAVLRGSIEAVAHEAAWPGKRP
jgi:type IV secretory pathway VirJ component